MPAKDLYHDAVRKALENDGWTVTHDPYTMKWGRKDLHIDLGAERLIAAEKIGHKIAVEVKSFVGQSEVNDLEHALGQFILYHDILANVESDRTLYLAIRDTVFVDVFQEPIGEVLLHNQRLRLIVFQLETETVTQWIP